MRKNLEIDSFFDIMVIIGVSEVMASIQLFIQGLIIGIGKIIPGVSGAMFAVMFGVYEKALYIISHLKKESFKNLKFIIVLGLGILLAIILGSNVIRYCLKNYYLATMFLFIGMMVAGIRPLFQKVKGEKIDYKNIIFTILNSFLLVGLDSLDLQGIAGSISKNISNVLLLIFSGFLDAVATIVPGICGTALLMIIGYYDTVIYSLSDLFHFEHLANNLFVLVPFVIGMLLGVIIVSKLIHYLFEHHKTKTYCVIIGFAIMSTVLLFIQTLSSSFQIIEFLLLLYFLF